MIDIKAKITEYGMQCYEEGKIQGRADAIDECINTIIDYCGGLPNGMYVNALEQLKEKNQ